jgi:hypothetical protein
MNVPRGDPGTHPSPIIDMHNERSVSSVLTTNDKLRKYQANAWVATYWRCRRHKSSWMRIFLDIDILEETYLAAFA